MYAFLSFLAPALLDLFVFVCGVWPIVLLMIPTNRRIRGKSGGHGIVVTESVASVIGRITAQDTAGEIFCERVAAEVHEYLAQVRQDKARSSMVQGMWQCRLCPFKSFSTFSGIRNLQSHVEKQHQGGMKHPLDKYTAFARNLFDTCT